MAIETARRPVMNMAKQILFCVLLVIVSGGIARASNLEAMIGASDVVVIGTLSQEINMSGPVTVLTVNVERFIKAESAGTSSPLTVQWLPQYRGVGPKLSEVMRYTLPTAYRGIWFLKRSTDNTFKPMPVRLGAQAGLVDLFYQLSASAIADGLKSPPARSVAEELAVEIANSTISETSNEFPGSLVSATYGLDSPVITGLFRFLSSSPKSRSRATGLAGLIFRGDTSALLLFEQEAPALGPRDILLPLAELRGSFRNPDTAAIACLARMAASKEIALENVGDTAALVLGAIHTKATLAALVALLDSPRSQRRSRAVVGLASFVNGLPIQNPSNVANLGYLRPTGPAPFRSPETLGFAGVPFGATEAEESTIIRFWKTWWADHQGQLSQ